MKKILTLVLILTLSIGLSACQKEEPSEPINSDSIDVEKNIEKTADEIEKDIKDLAIKFIDNGIIWNEDILKELITEESILLEEVKPYLKLSDRSTLIKKETNGISAEESVNEDNNIHYKVYIDDNYTIKNKETGEESTYNFKHQIHFEKDTLKIEGYVLEYGAKIK